MQAKLSDGTLVEIDATDLPLLQMANWQLAPSNHVRHIMTLGHAVRGAGCRLYYSLARLIVGAAPDQKVIFVNGNVLDFRRENLHVAPKVSYKITSPRSIHPQSAFSVPADIIDLNASGASEVAVQAKRRRFRPQKAQSRTVRQVGVTNL